ncbi:MAG: glycosyltransferase [Chitinophagaceae bacterium]
MRKVNKIIILDEFLETKVGHYYEYDKSVIQSFQEQGIKYALYTKNSIANEIKEELNAIPFFEYNANAFVRKIIILGAFLYRFTTWWSISKQLIKIINKEFKPQNGIEFFVPNIFWYNVLPYALAFSKAKAPVSLLYRTSVLEAIDISPSFKLFIFKLYNWSFTLFSRNQYIRFVTDSDVIANQFTEKYKKPMTVLPIPHVFEMEDLNYSNIEKNKFKLYLPGAARIEKGIECITEAIEYIKRHNPIFFDKLVIVLQFFGEKEKQELEALKTRIINTKCETLFLEKLSSEEYKFHFGSADIILIPYLNSRGYRARTSGVLAEAIAACKPFITSKDSWMDWQKNKYQTGLAVVDTNAEDLAHAIIEIMSNYNTYKSKALAAKDTWLEFHSKENFYNTFINI